MAAYNTRSTKISLGNRESNEGLLLKASASDLATIGQSRLVGQTIKALPVKEKGPAGPLSSRIPSERRLIPVVTLSEQVGHHLCACVASVIQARQTKARLDGLEQREMRVEPGTFHATHTVIRIHG